MPGLLRAVGRTAVIAGTATAVSGNVQRRQAERHAKRDEAEQVQLTRVGREEMIQHATPQSLSAVWRRRFRSSA